MDFTEQTSTKHIRNGVIILVYNTIIQDRPEYLLVKQRNNSWSLPSGGREENETELEAAKRELYEETGIEATQMQETDIINEFQYDEDTIGIQKGFLYACNLTSIPGTVLTDEIQEVMWVTKEQAKEFLLKPNQYSVFEKLTTQIPK